MILVKSYREKVWLVNGRGQEPIHFSGLPERLREAFSKSGVYEVRITRKGYRRGAIRVDVVREVFVCSDYVASYVNSHGLICRELFKGLRQKPPSLGKRKTFWVRIKKVKK